MNRTACWALAMLCAVGATAQPQFELSRNVYRIPYGSGTSVRVSNDHYTHNPLGRYDLVGEGAGESCTTNYRIVAAAGGVVRRLVDNHDVHGPDCTSNCTDFNNYLWIEHANGEWTKYSHMRKNSSSVSAGLAVGDTVSAGTFLGYECDIGQASGPHLHWEVRRPNDPTNVQITTAGGFMSDAAHCIAVLNSFSKHFFEDGDTRTASGSTGCPATNVAITLPTTIGNGGIRIHLAGTAVSTQANTVVTFQNGANGLFQAGSSVTLSPGFAAEWGSSFEARIGSCATTQF